MDAQKVQTYEDILNSKDDKIYYFKDHEFKFWYFYYPKYGFINILNHDITENENGTITVKQKIIVKPNEIEGHLINGIWE